ncbi:MAG: hypothetical protein CMK74_22245 [Pseudomonadales bacterium]|nr:hypothetical protein [Pseudomonadales bacterium]|tara:strand:+ start:333 stop:914 length:582 start_codon:yes stop_codon:yes gene_type:complete
MTQQFNQPVDQVAAGNINNYLGPAEEKEPLSNAQRKRLNVLVAEVSETLELDARDIWRDVVHAHVGVDSINEIQRSQFSDAVFVLENFRETERMRVNTRLMVSRITSLTKEKKIYDERDAFCLRTFGERHLNHMTIEQLRQVLAFVEDFQAVEPATNTGLDLTPEAILAVVSRYPVHFGATLVIGALIGAVLF